MSDLTIAADWMDGDLDFPEETATFAEIAISVSGIAIGQIFDPDLSTLAEGPRLPASLLADGLVGSWWTLLYEPRKIEDTKFEARHRLDALTRGYVFTPLALWSAGDAVSAAVVTPDTRFQRQVFLLPEKRGPWTLAREGVEAALGAFVQSVLSRLSNQDCEFSSLTEGWQRIVESSQDPDERLWCINAGRLGLDPYDPTTPDLSRISEGLSDGLFGDICEAAEAAELNRTCNWVRAVSMRLQNAPPIQIKQFGAPLRRDLTQPSYRDGYDSVRLLRQRTGLPKEPTRAVKELFGDALMDVHSRFSDETPESMEGLARRNGHDMRAVVSAKSSRQGRFRMCRAAYIAWRAGATGDGAITTASTWRQQASRAFAAELLAPADLLRERVGSTGLTQDKVEGLAEEWGCPSLAIIHQAQNHDIPLRGVQTSAQY